MKLSTIAAKNTWTPEEFRRALEYVSGEPQPTPEDIERNAMSDTQNEGMEKRAVVTTEAEKKAHDEAAKKAEELRKQAAAKKKADTDGQ